MGMAHFFFFFFGGGGGFKLLIFQYFWEVLEKWRKMGYEDLVHILGGHHKTGLFWGLLCILGSFIKVKVEIGNIFLGLLMI